MKYEYSIQVLGHGGADLLIAQAHIRDDGTIRVSKWGKPKKKMNKAPTKLHDAAWRTAVHAIAILLAKDIKQR